MSTKIFSYINDFFIFFLIFSFFNDNFMVDYFGEKSLKVLFLLFYAFYFPAMLRNFKTMTTTQDKLFFAFFTANAVVFLLQIIISPMDDIVFPALLQIASFSIILYFSRYPLKKLLYFVWLSMMLSVIISFFNVPISQWTFRTSGGTADPNEFATQLLAFLFATFYLYIQNRNILFLLLSIIFFTYGIFHAGSMSSFLMLGVVGIFSIMRLAIMQPKKIFNYKVLLGLIFLILISTQANLSKIDTIANVLNRTKTTHTADFRMHSWKAGQHMIEDNFFLGVGVYEFGNNTPKYEEAPMVGSAPAPHNIYIQLFAESGVIVFTLFVIFIGYLLISNFKRLFYTSDWLIATMLLSTLLMGMTLGITYDKYFWIIIAIMMNLNHHLNRRQGIL